MDIFIFNRLRGLGTSSLALKIWRFLESYSSSVYIGRQKKLGFDVSNRGSSTDWIDKLCMRWKWCGTLDENGPHKIVYFIGSGED